MPGITRRGLIGGVAAFCATRGRADVALRFALTPVILDNDADAAETLRAALSAASGHAIDLVRRPGFAAIPICNTAPNWRFWGFRSGGADRAINPI